MGFAAESRANRQLYLEIDTFARVSERGERLCRLVQQLRDELIEPVLRLAPRVKPSWTMAPRIGSSSREYRWSERNWQLLLDRLEAGELGELFLWLEIPPDDNVQRLLQRLAAGDLADLEQLTAAAAASGTRSSLLLSAELQLRVRSEYTADWAYCFAASCSPAAFGGELPLDVQRSWIGLAKEAACALEAATGYVTFDDRGGATTSSPYESRHTIEDGLVHAREYARGYYWGNVLGPEQLRRLGGLQTVLAAPFHAVDVVCREPEIAYVQLTEDVRTVTDDDLGRLRDFLRPVLRPVTTRVAYSGPALRVLDEP